MTTMKRKQQQKKQQQQEQQGYEQQQQQGGRRKGSATRKAGKGSRKASPWNKLVMKVYSEMKKKNSSVSFSDALKAASKRKSEM